ncbi:MAG: hypothetical protein AAGH64_04190 [Planctomycetota bacterium]
MTPITPPGPPIAPLPRSLRVACRRRRIARGFADACVAAVILAGVGATLMCCV